LDTLSGHSSHTGAAPGATACGRDWLRQTGWRRPQEGEHVVQEEHALVELDDEADHGHYASLAGHERAASEHERAQRDATLGDARDQHRDDARVAQGREQAERQYREDPPGLQVPEAPVLLAEQQRVFGEEMLNEPEEAHFLRGVARDEQGGQVGKPSGERRLSPHHLVVEPGHARQKHDLGDDAGSQQQRDHGLETEEKRD